MLRTIGVRNISVAVCHCMPLCAIVCPAHRSCMTRRAMCGTFNAYTHPALLQCATSTHTPGCLDKILCARLSSPHGRMHRTLDAESREKEMTLGHSGQSAPCLYCSLCGPPRPPRAVRACGRAVRLAVCLAVRGLDGRSIKRATPAPTLLLGGPHTPLLPTDRAGQ